MTARSWTRDRMRVLMAEFERQADPTRAPDMKRYMKGRFSFFGIGSVERRRIQRDVFKEAPTPTQAELVEITRTSWRRKERELQYFGADYVRAHIGDCDAAFLSHLEFLITHKSWWDTVDLLAIHGVGPLAKRWPRVRKEMDRWIESEDPWIARSAILFQLTYKNDTSRQRLFRFCKARMRDQDFFVRKAIGWALREYSRTNPTAVRRFVAQNEANLSPLSSREALKLLKKKPA